MTNEQLERLKAVDKPSEMTLLDYFAGQALGKLADEYELKVNYGKIAEKCYELAKAMLAEREKRTKTALGYKKPE